MNNRRRFCGPLLLCAMLWALSVRMAHAENAPSRALFQASLDTAQVWYSPQGDQNVWTAMGATMSASVPLRNWMVGGHSSALMGVLGRYGTVSDIRGLDIGFSGARTFGLSEGGSKGQIGLEFAFRHYLTTDLLVGTYDLVTYSLFIRYLQETERGVRFRTTVAGSFTNSDTAVVDFGNTLISVSAEFFVSPGGPFFLGLDGEYGNLLLSSSQRMVAQIRLRMGLAFQIGQN